MDDTAKLVLYTCGEDQIGTTNDKNAVGRVKMTWHPFIVKRQIGDLQFNIFFYYYNMYCGMFFNTHIFAIILFMLQTKTNFR